MVFIFSAKRIKDDDSSDTLSRNPVSDPIHEDNLAEHNLCNEPKLFIAASTPLYQMLLSKRCKLSINILEMIQNISRFIRSSLKGFQTTLPNP